MTQDIPPELVAVVIRHGAAIERVIKDPAVIEAFTALDQYYFQHWKSAEDPVDRQTLWDEMRALDRLRKHFETAVSVGQDEQTRLDRAESPRNLP